jgi:hypothetical protein
MQHKLPAVPRLDNNWCNLHCKSPYATYTVTALLIRENLDCREPGTLPRSATIDELFGERSHKLCRCLAKNLPTPYSLLQLSMRDQ